MVTKETMDQFQSSVRIGTTWTDKDRPVVKIEIRKHYVSMDVLQCTQDVIFFRICDQSSLEAGDTRRLSTISITQLSLRCNASSAITGAMGSYWVPL